MAEPTHQPPSTAVTDQFTSVRHAEAHLLDAHGESIDPSIRPSLDEINEWHAQAHAGGRCRYPHHHGEAGPVPATPATIPAIHVIVAGDTPLQAHAYSGAQLHISTGDEAAVVLAADTAAGLGQFLARALLDLHSADPSWLPQPAPAEQLVEARAVIVEDVLRCLGQPADAPTSEIGDVSVTDVRTARRMADHTRQLLDDAIEAHHPHEALIVAAIGAQS